VIIACPGFVFLNGRINGSTSTNQGDLIFLEIGRFFFHFSVFLSAYTLLAYTLLAYTLSGFNKSDSNYLKVIHS